MGDAYQIYYIVFPHSDPTRHPFSETTVDSTVLEWSIWKSRRSFEELVAAYGMSKKSARKMGAV